MSKSKKAGFIVLAVISIAALVGLSSVYYFRTHFFLNTSINGVDVSFLSVEKSKEKIDNTAKDYAVTIIGKDKETEVINAKSFSLKTNIDNGDIERFLQEQNEKDYKELFSGIEKAVNYHSNTLITYNSRELFNEVRGLSCIKNNKGKMEKNATFALKNGKYEIVKEEYGTRIDAKDLCSKIGKETTNLNPQIEIFEEKFYKQPTITENSPKLQKFVSKLNECLDMEIEYEAGEVITGTQIVNWIDTDNDLNYSFNEDRIRSFVERMSAKYNTVGKERTFMTSYGNPVNVRAGNYGWKIDEDAEVKEILKNLKDRKSIKRDFAYISKANSHGANDYGNSYVEINLSGQHLFLYKNGNLVLESPFVSGCIEKGHATPTGAYRIFYTQRNAVLRGEDYVSPVSFWMPFNGGVGMHDANWRSEFGGDIYITNGSHGCINLPYSSARDIYNVVSTGYPVLVYRM